MELLFLVLMLLVILIVVVGGFYALAGFWIWELAAISMPIIAAMLM